MANPNPKIEHLQMWQKGKSGNPAGKPKKLLTQLKGMGYTRAEVSNLINLMLSMRVAELRKIAAADKCDMLERTIAKALVHSFDKGSLYSIDNLLSRSHGKPTEMVEVKGEESKVIVVQYGQNHNTIQPTSGAVAGTIEPSEVSSADVWQEVREITDQPDNID